MKYNKKYFAFEVVLNLYKDGKIELVSAVKLIRAIIRGIGLKDARDWFLNKSDFHKEG